MGGIAGTSWMKLEAFLPVKKRQLENASHMQANHNERDAPNFAQEEGSLAHNCPACWLLLPER